MRCCSWVVVCVMALIDGITSSYNASHDGLLFSVCGHSALCLTYPPGCTADWRATEPVGHNEGGSGLADNNLCSLGVMFSRDEPGGGKPAGSVRNPRLRTPSITGDWVNVTLFTRLANMKKGPEYNRYVAVGFSDDPFMGDDVVFECVHSNTFNQQSSYLSTNVAHKNARSRTDLQKLVMSNQSYSLVDNRLVCNFRLHLATECSDPHPICSLYSDLSQPFHILLASGPSFHYNKGEIPLLQYHDERYSTIDKISLAKMTVVPAAGFFSSRTKSLLLKLHGVFMLYGWWVLCGSAIFFAKYFKQIWRDVLWFENPVFLVFHRTLNWLSLAFILTGMVLIFVYSEGLWLVQNAAKRNHAICGITAFILCCIQPFLAAFRCQTGSGNYALFVWLHRLFGLAAWLLASAVMFMSTDLVGSGLHSYLPTRNLARVMMIGYFIIVAAILAFMEIHMTVTERCHTMQTYRCESLDSPNMQLHLRKHGAHRNAPPGVRRTLSLVRRPELTAHELRLPYHVTVIRCFMFAVFLTASLCFTTALSVLLVMGRSLHIAAPP